MVLAVAANFTSLTEAHVAAAALRAAGFQAEVLDGQFGVQLWHEQRAIGGFRIVVPAEEQLEANAFLRAVAADAPRRRRDPRDRGWLWRILALALAFLAPTFGWLVVAVRRDRYASAGPSLALKAFLSIAGAAAIVAVLYGLRYLGVQHYNY